jgi:hypothetical protein
VDRIESFQPVLYTLQAADTHKRFMYNGLNSCSPCFGRCRALFLPLREIITDTISKPLAVIESLALTPIQFFGALFSKNCSIEDSVFYLEKAVVNLVDIPLSLVVAPFRYIYQVSSIFWDPKEAKCFRANPCGTENSSSIKQEFRRFQARLYQTDKSPMLFRVISPFTALVDVVADALCPIAETIERVVSIFQQFLGAVTLQKGYTFKTVFIAIEGVHTKLACAVGGVVALPIKFLHQMFAIIYDPENAYSISRKSQLDELWELSFNKENPDEVNKAKNYLQKMSSPCIEERISYHSFGPIIPIEKLKGFNWLTSASILGAFPLAEEAKPTPDEIDRFHILPASRLQAGLVSDDDDDDDKELVGLLKRWLPYASKKQIQGLDLSKALCKAFPNFPLTENEIKIVQALPVAFFHNKTMLHSLLPYLSANQIKDGALLEMHHWQQLNAIFSDMILDKDRIQPNKERIQSIPTQDLQRIFPWIDRHYNDISAQQYQSLDIAKLSDNTLRKWLNCRRMRIEENTIVFFDAICAKKGLDAVKRMMGEKENHPWEASLQKKLQKS